MFVAINPLYTKKRRKIYPKIIDLGYMKYLSLDLPLYKKEPDFKGLSEGVIYLMPKNLTVPKFIKKYGSKEWELNLLVIKFIKTVKEQKSNVIIFDENGNFVELVKRILPHAKQTAVFTKNEELYSQFCASCFKEFGCPIRINNYAGINDGITFGNNHLNDSKFNAIKLNFDDIKIPYNLDKELNIPVSKLDLSEALYLNGFVKNPSIFI